MNSKGHEAIDERTALARAEAFLRDLPVPPVASGRGVVICGGGPRYFPGAWITIRMLRHSGCELPIELWHLGPREMTRDMRDLVEPYNVVCVDADSHPARAAVTRPSGWELKPFALLHSSFREIIFLDADNVPLSDPEVLFSSEAYDRTRAIFWPDVEDLAPTAPIWRLCGVSPRRVPQWETGQILIDKVRHWAALRLAHWYCQNGGFFWRYINGDKEAFHLAFRRLGAPFAMTESRPEFLDGLVLFQHDLAGRRLFQHRVGDKWSLEGANALVAGFEHEDQCFALLDELRSLWRPWFSDEGRSAAQRAAAKRLTRGVFRLHCDGHDDQRLSFLPEGRVGEGFSHPYRTWDIAEVEDGRIALDIWGAAHHTCRLIDDGASWHGEGGRFERLHYTMARDERELEGPILVPAVESRTFDATVLTRTLWRYWRQDLDARPMRFLPDGRIGRGSRKWEVRWSVVDGERGEPVLRLWGEGALTVELRRHGAEWRGRWGVHEGPIVSLRPFDEKELRPSLLMVAPTMPDPGGVGLARRCSRFLEAAWARWDVHLLVIPVSGGSLAPPSLTREHCVRIVVEPVEPGTALPRADGPGSEEDPVGGPLPGACRFATAELLERCRGAFDGESFDAVHVSRLYMTPYARPFLEREGESPSLVTLDLDDLESESARRMAELHAGRGDGARAELALAEATRFAAMEARELPRFDRVFVAADRDRQTLVQTLGLDNLATIPNAVEVPEAPVMRPRSGSAPALLFVGNLGYPPNEDAARWLCEEIAPKLGALRGDRPSVMLVGASPSQEVRRLAERDGVQVYADVPSVSPYYEAADIVVVPLRAGGGTRLKILEAFAQGLPVVSTTLGAEGLAAADDGSVAIADDAGGLAAACARILDDPEWAASLVERGRERVLADHGLEACWRNIARAWEEVSSG